MTKYLRLILGLAAAATALFAQGNTASILGTVTDSSGALVPGISVIVTNIATGVAIPTTTNSAGEYAVRSINPGTYVVEAEAVGFKKFRREHVALDMGRELRINIQLEPGQVNESVVVTGSSPLLETESGALSTRVDAKQIAELPRRNAQDLAGLAPGMTDTGQDPQPNGGIGGKDSVMIDGAPVLLQVNTGVAALPQTDFVEAVTVMTHSFSAEFGDTSGSVTVASTKSGTNEFHGNVFEYFQNTHLDAGNLFTHVVPVNHVNQFGGTIGGPIKKNKTFFFFGFQDSRGVTAGQFTGITVPTDAFKQGNFSSVLGKSIGTDARGNPVLQNQIFDPLTSQTVTTSGKSVVVRNPFPANTIPASRLSPAALKLQALYPEPLANTSFTNFNNSGPNSTFTKIYDIRGDHNFSDRDRLMLSYSKRFDDFGNASPLPNPIANGGTAGQVPWTRPDHAATANWVHVFSSTLLNDMHVNWFQLYSKRDDAGFSKVGAADFSINGMPDGNQKLGTPNITFTNFQSLGSAAGALWHELQSQRSIVDGATWMRGKHSLKFGGEVRQIRTDNYQFTPWKFVFNSDFTNQVGFAASGFDYASFLLGLPYNYNYQIFPSFFRPRAAVYALYAQDDIRVSPKLTVNVGLRWDAPTYYHEAHNLTSNFDLSKNQYVQLGVNGMRSTAWNNSWFNFGPRFGFAYTPFADSKTVIRGGFGMFTVGNALSGATGYLNNSPFFADSDGGRYQSTDNITWKTTLDNIPYAPLDKLGTNAKAVSVFPAYNPMSYMEQWNLAVGHQFRSIMVEVGYAGQHGVHMPAGAYNANAIPLAMAPVAQGHFTAAYVPYPLYPSGVTINSWTESTRLNELEIKAEKRFSSGVSFLGAYTWQKPIVCGDGQYRDPVGNRNLDCGISGLGNQRRLTASWVWELPLGTGRKWLSKNLLRYPFGGWEIDGIATFLSGGWLTTTTSTDTEVIGASTTRPNLMGNPVLPSDQRSLNEWYNVNAFAVPQLYTAGNAGRSLMLGPGKENVDLTIARRFDGFGSERRYLQFRWEFYNISNTPFYANPNTTIGSATAGRITSASNARIMQAALKFYF